MAWRNFAERNPDLPVGFIIQSATATEVPQEIIDAYEAPWPNAESKAGVAQFPLLVPIERGRARRGRDERRRASGSSRWEKPALVCFSDSDPIFPPKAGQRFVDLIPGAQRAARDRGRRPLPPGGQGRGDRGGRSTSSSPGRRVHG